MEWLGSVLSYNTLYCSLFGACLGSLWVIMVRTRETRDATDAIRRRMNDLDAELQAMRILIVALHEKYGPK